MSGRVKQRNAANSADLATLSVNERILKDIHSLYADPDKGLVSIVSDLDVTIQAPRKKVVVMLIGNHSAGKSTFINWYIEEHVQRTGVAIETQGFTLITSGKKRESLTGNATLHLYPQFRDVVNMKGLVDYINTEISTSKQKKFSLVTFIDTPGLVDGEMAYPYDVDEAILWFGQLADLILVFFDPIGQALCKRTLNLVEKLNSQHSERVRFYLSKADEAGPESDRQKVMMQIVQELCKRPGLNKCGFDMPTIYIPNPNKPSRCSNQIEDICKDVEKTINQTVQNALNSLEKDCDLIGQLIHNKIEEDDKMKYHNLRSSWRGILYAIVGTIIPIMIFLNFLSSKVSMELLVSVTGITLAEHLLMYLSPIKHFWWILPQGVHIYGLLLLLSVSVVFLYLAKCYISNIPTLSRKQKKILLEKRDYVHNFVKTKKQQFYDEYLKQMVADYDL